jgi:cytochrome c oxidase subunit 3
MVSVGTIVWLASELMFFAALFAAYFTIRAVSPELWAQNTEKLNVPFSAVNTTILVLSSVSCQLGVFKAEDGVVGRTGKIHQIKLWGLREWFVLTYLMGATFIAGQAFEYAKLVHEGVTIPSSAYGTASTACTSPAAWWRSSSFWAAPSSPASSPTSRP